MNKWMVVVFPWPQNRGWFRPTHGELIREQVGGNESTAFIAGEHPSTRAYRQTNRQVDQKRHDHDPDAGRHRNPRAKDYAGQHVAAQMVRARQVQVQRETFDRGHAAAGFADVLQLQDRGHGFALHRRGQGSA